MTTKKQLEELLLDSVVKQLNYITDPAKVSNKDRVDFICRVLPYLISKKQINDITQEEDREDPLSKYLKVS